MGGVAPQWPAALARPPEQEPAMCAKTVQRSTVPAVRARQGASHTVQAYSYRRFFARRGNECRAVEFQGELVAMLRRRALAVGLDWVGADSLT